MENTEWIKPSQKLPYVDRWVSESVLVKTKYGIDICSYVPEDWTVDGWTYKKGWYRHPGSEPIDDEVIGWMDLPE